MTREEYDKLADEAFDRSDFAEAHRLGDAMVKEGMDRGWYYMSVASMNMQQAAQGEKEIRKYLETNDDADGWYVLGANQVWLGDHYSAISSFEKAVERGSNAALGMEAVSRYNYARPHLNDAPDNAEMNGELFDLLETAIAQSVECIQNNPADYNGLYGVLPKILYTDYSLVLVGRTVYTEVTKTEKNLFGDVVSSDSYKVHAPMSSSNIWEWKANIDNMNATVANQAAAVFKRDMKIANFLEDAGRKADAAMVRFEMIYADITLNGQRGIAQDAAWFYQLGHKTAMEQLGDGYASWAGDYRDAETDYHDLLQKFGKEIKAFQNSGRTPDLLRYYLDESRIPAQTEDLLRSARATAEVETFGKDSGKITFKGILAALGKADILALAPTVGAGLIYAIFKHFGNVFGTVFFIFALIVFLVGLKNSSKKIAAESERKCHQLGQIGLFVLYVINFFVGLVATVAAKFLF